MEESLGRYITSTAKYINYYINTEANRLNLNIHQMQLLLILYENAGINQEELTEIYKSDKITISKRLDKLVQEGYIEKKKNENDKRVKNLYVTEKGYNIREEICDILKNVTKTLAKDFSKEEDLVIRDLLKRMLNNIYKEINGF